ncbi:hypothetical protein Megvenef_01256 [Candidatus Megaera venefica]|uniref:Ubiquitin-like protease family profile domain-containing protein n=2 Tax=Candidatus Megaera venefica TaxID=2055910 RepID=A0ABU5NDL6_9RICK|nr:hypothetical protein [Candidatus Megaera venefica]
MITTGKSDWEGSSYRDTSDKKAKSGERLWSENSREILKPPAPDYSFLEAMNNTNPANLLNIEKTKIKKTLFDTILCGFNIKQQDYNLSEYNQGFYKYTLNAVSYILELRIIDLQLKNMKVLQAIFIDQNYNNISDILTQISTSTEKLTLVPVNLYNKHAVGIIFEKDKYTNMIHVKYLDSLNKHMSQELKQFITHTLDSQVDFQEITVEQQKYANCGSQVIENFIFYLTGHKVSQEKAIELHSKLVENTLLNNNISEVYLMFEQQFNSFKFATSSEQIEHTPDLFYNVDCNNLQLEVAGEINSFY